MTWSYDSSDPGATSKDQVRLMVGDTDTADQLLTDEEIAHFLTTYLTVGNAAVQSARAIMAQFTRQVTRAVGDLKINLSDRAKAYKELIVELTEMADASDPFQIYAGGLSLADRNEDRANVDLPQPPFEVGMTDYTPRMGANQRFEDPLVSGG
ncbi:hypothetical protein LCGC14_0592250 [marine sediment metagenome]|uniref:Uncharacterized protein n=1 Tax=marine sediment metagenome TaxID=412755 RepID=A0A0F9RWU6_9ZZZZ